MNKVEYLHMMQQSVKSGERDNVSVRDIDIALEEISKLQTEIERLHQCIRIADKSTDSFMRANENLRAERDEALIKLDEMVEIGNKAEFWEREFKRQQACVYQRSGDGLKAQGDSKSIELIRAALRSHEEVVPELRNRLKQAMADRDELIEMLRETLKYGISDSRRKAAYDLVVRLGGYHGKTEATDGR